MTDQVADLELLLTFQGVVLIVLRVLILVPPQDLVLLLLKLGELPVMFRGVETAVLAFLAVLQIFCTSLLLAFQKLQEQLQQVRLPLY